MFVLIGEEEGDYGDYYQRNRNPLAVSDAKETLEKWLEENPNEDYVDYVIEEVPLL